MFGERLVYSCQLCVLGAHSSLFGVLGVIVCSVCWELVLLCLECWVLLFVVCAGRLLLFGVNDGPCSLFVLGGYFLCSHQIDWAAEQFLSESVRLISETFRDVGFSQLLR
jgi:hypothetical protein